MHQRYFRIVCPVRLFRLTSFAVVLLLLGSVQAVYASNSSGIYIDTSLPKVYSNSCHLSQIETTPKWCAYGDLDSKFKVVLVGDSHAAQWFPALEKLALKNNFKLLSLTHSSCPFVYLEFYAQCKQWNSNVVKLINRWNPDVLVWANLITLNYPTAPPTNITKEAWEVGFQNRLNQIKIKKKHIVYVQDSPYPNFDILNCLNTNPDVEICNFAFNPNQIENAVFQILKLNKISIVRTQNWFCDTNICGVIKDNFNVYRDYSHISVPMSENLSSKLEQTFIFTSKFKA
jgi:SGNH domain (fused to AT3 domains)